MIGAVKKVVATVAVMASACDAIGVAACPPGVDCEANKIQAAAKATGLEIAIAMCQWFTDVGAFDEYYAQGACAKKAQHQACVCQDLLAARQRGEI